MLILGRDQWERTGMSFEATPMSTHFFFHGFALGHSSLKPFAGCLQMCWEARSIFWQLAVVQMFGLVQKGSRPTREKVG